MKAIGPLLINILEAIDFPALLDYFNILAEFDSSENSFMLTGKLFTEEKIHPGLYRIGKNIEDANTYRVGHPLAQRIIDKCKNQDLSLY
jgi:hypothetical protein